MSPLPSISAQEPDTETDVEAMAARAFLDGGGIASLAAAAFMIRDGDMLGHNITIFEELGVRGGSLDGSGSAQNGYVLRGGADA